MVPELVEEDVEDVDVVAAPTGKRLEVVDVDEIDLVQSSQALPLSEGHCQEAGWL